jgi:mono/diheme cytochrome c family protein
MRRELVIGFGVALGLCAAAGSAQANSAQPTFTKDIAPIFYANCVACHQPDEIAPFSLLDYESARPWAKSIREAVMSKKMPPWHADSSQVAYLNERSISQEQIDLIAAWVEQGAKRGDPADMPAAPPAEEFWAMGEPDMIFEADRDFVVPAGQQQIEYQSIHMDPIVPDDLYVTQWEIRPTNRKAVHHANLVRAPQELESVGIGQAALGGGDYIGSYLPGARPMRYPEGAALYLPKGSFVQIQVHYVGLDEPVTDHIQFGVKLANGRVDRIVRTCGTDDYAIRIEPNGTFAMDTEVTLNYPLTILSSGAHMHTRGRGYTTTAILPDGTSKLITNVPVYDWNWQSNYELANPISVPAGTKYHVLARWDNTKDNPENPDPNAVVTYGPWTENEMLTTWSHVVLTEEKLGLKVEDGRVVGKFDDAIDSQHPGILQSLPNTFTRPRKPKPADTDD